MQVPTAYHMQGGLPTLGFAIYNIAMSSHRFADFLERLQADGRLVRRDESVSRCLKIDGMDDGGKPGAELLTNVSDSVCPMVCGIFSFREAILAALGAASFQETAARLDELLAGTKEGGWLERLGGGASGAVRKYQAKTVRTGPSQQIAHLGRDVDLSGLPATTCHADETYPAFTAGRVIARWPDSGALYVGCHEFRVLDSNRLLACWHPASGAAQILAHHRRRSETMPIAVAFGGEPIDFLVSMAPLPQNIERLPLAGYLRGTACEMVSGRRVDLPVPADAETVIEGTLEPAEPCVDAGRGLDRTGLVRQLRPAPTVHVQAVTHRPTPLLSALLPKEKGMIHRALAKIFLPFLRQQLPGLADLEFPALGGDRVWAFASIDQTYVGQAGQFANAFWGLPAMLPVRYLVVVDDEVDVGDSDQVWAAVSAHALPSSDIHIGAVPPDEFIYDQPPGRMVIDATRPI